MKIFKGMLKLLLGLIFILFILIGILNFQSAPSAKGLFGYKGYIVTSGSMEPSFSPGDYIIVKNESFSDLENGDVVTFVADESIVTHRVTEVTADGLTTKGDANEYEDSMFVSVESYIGRLEWILPAFGSFILFLQQPFIFPLMILIFGGYVIFLYMTSNKEETTTE